MKKFLLIFIIFLSALSIDAQTRVTGRVTDEGGEPLIGAVITYNSKGVCVTDLDGMFSFNAADFGYGKYVVSYLGFQSYTFYIYSIYASSHWNIVMKEENSLELATNIPFRF